MWGMNMNSIINKVLLQHTRSHQSLQASTAFRSSLLPSTAALSLSHNEASHRQVSWAQTSVAWRTFASMPRRLNHLNPRLPCGHSRRHARSGKERLAFVLNQRAPFGRIGIHPDIDDFNIFRDHSGVESGILQREARPHDREHRSSLHNRAMWCDSDKHLALHLHFSLSMMIEPELDPL
jgi:hypothetical protein